MNDLRTAAQQALAALEYHTEQTRPIQRTADAIATLRAALAEDARDWSLLEATQESLREHMAEVQRLRAALAQPATIAEWWAAKQAASGEPAEPVAYRYRIRRPGGIEGETWHLIGSPGQRDATSASLGAPAEPLYTAQPAPARVPLTDSALLDAFCVTPGIHQFIQAFKAGARFAERAHGITPAKEAP